VRHFIYPTVHAVLLLAVDAGVGTAAGVEGEGVGTLTTGGDTGLEGVTGVGAGTGVGVGVDAMTRPVVEAMTRPVVEGTEGVGVGVEITGGEGVTPA